MDVRTALLMRQISVTEGRVVVEPVSHFLPMSVFYELKLRGVHLNVGQPTTAGSAFDLQATEEADHITLRERPAV
ncbi:MAG: hypothetical protein M3N91_15415 [Pseudomonadota bacterium]|nr:hypothetical protein [Pseudomonadota bacterium]